MTAAPSDTSRARKSRPGAQPQLRAKRESKPTRLSTRWNHRAHRDTAIPPCWPPPLSRLARARSTWGKHVPLPTANHRARTRIGRTVGSNTETPCPDEKSMSLGRKARPLHCCSGEPVATQRSPAASGSKGSFATLSQLGRNPLHNWGRRMPQVQSATRLSRLPKSPSGLGRQ